MPGMNSGLSDTNPVLVAAFKAALLHQGLAVVALLAVMALAWLGVRQWLPRRPAWPRAGPGRASDRRPRASAGRRLLRIGFGILWILDGLLQAQPAMPAGLPGQVIAPAAAGSPGWVQHLVNWAGTTWSYHPVQAGAAAVWIQVGIGAWLVAARPRPGLAAGRAGQRRLGRVVWVFGEALGGILAPGQSVLYGAPGAVLLYLAAGAAGRAARPVLADGADRAADPRRRWACSSSAWRSCRPGRVAASGPAPRPGGPARWPAWPAPCPRSRSPASWPAGSVPSGPWPRRTASRSTWPP